MATPIAQSIFAAPTNRNKPLVEFKAGKMLIRGKMVIPDKRKGKIELAQSPDDQLMHFRWKDRSTGQVETDLIIFPDEAVFKKVKQCTTGRVFLLEWKSTERRLFFWMQEPSDEKDAELCEKVNKALNSPPAAEGGEAGAGGVPGLAGMSQEQLLAMMGMGGLGGMGGGGGARRGSARGAAAASAPPSGAQPAAGGARSAAPTPSTPAPTTTARSTDASIGEQQLQNILRELGAAQGGGAGAAGGQAPEDVDLSSVMTSEALLPLLSNPAVAEQLLPYLPEGQRNPEELRELVRSPQFHQALQAFNSALQSGALADVLPALGLPASAAGGGVQDFLRALQEQSQRQTGGQQQQQGGSQEGGNEPAGGEKKDDKDGSSGKDGDMDTS